MLGVEDLGASNQASERIDTIAPSCPPNVSNRFYFGTQSHPRRYLIRPHSAVKYNFVRSRLPVHARSDAVIQPDYSSPLLPEYCTDDRTTEW